MFVINLIRPRLYSIDFRKYFIPTVIGAFPRTFILAIAGAGVREIFSKIGLGVDILFVLGVVGIFVLIVLEKLGYTDFFERFLMKRIREDLKKDQSSKT